MPDRHQRDKTTFRPPPEVKEAAQKALSDSPGDWTMNDFLVACLVLLAKNPKAMLDRLAEVRPQPKRGRPPKKREPGAE